MVTVFEGVLDSASGGDCDASVYDALPFTFYCVCRKVSDLHWGKTKVKTYTATPREQPAASLFKAFELFSGNEVQ